MHNKRLKLFLTLYIAALLMFICNFIRPAPRSSMSSLGSSSLKLIISDFDDTITSEDSLHLVIESATQYHKLPETTINDLVQEYCNSKDLFKAQYPELTKSRYVSIQDEIKYQQLMSRVENSSVLKAYRDKLFHGVPKQLFALPAAQIQTKLGFPRFLHHYYGKTPIVILSVNWSRGLLGLYFDRLGFPVAEGKLELVTNEFVFDDSGHCTGEIVEPQVRTGYDKLVVTRSLIDKYQAKDAVVYIGDSETDVLSMYECGFSYSMAGKKKGSYEMLMGLAQKEEKIASQGHFEVKDWNELIS